MKKILMLLVTFAAILLMVSCEKIEEDLPITHTVTLIGPDGAPVGEDLKVKDGETISLSDFNLDEEVGLVDRTSLDAPIKGNLEVKVYRRNQSVISNVSLTGAQLGGEPAVKDVDVVGNTTTHVYKGETQSDAQNIAKSLSFKAVSPLDGTVPGDDSLYLYFNWDGSFSWFEDYTYEVNTSPEATQKKATYKLQDFASLSDYHVFVTYIRFSVEDNIYFEGDATVDVKHGPHIVLNEQGYIYDEETDSVNIVVKKSSLSGIEEGDELTVLGIQLLVVRREPLREDLGRIQAYWDESEVPNIEVVEYPEYLDYYTSKIDDKSIFDDEGLEVFVKEVESGELSNTDDNWYKWAKTLLDKEDGHQIRVSDNGGVTNEYYQWNKSDNAWVEFDYDYTPDRRTESYDGVFGLETGLIWGNDTRRFTYSNKVIIDGVPVWKTAVTYIPSFTETNLHDAIYTEGDLPWIDESILGMFKVFYASPEINTDGVHELEQRKIEFNRTVEPEFGVRVDKNPAKPNDIYFSIPIQPNTVAVYQDEVDKLGIMSGPLFEFVIVVTTKNEEYDGFKLDRNSEDYNTWMPMFFGEGEYNWDDHYWNVDDNFSKNVISLYHVKDFGNGHINVKEFKATGDKALKLVGDANTKLILGLDYSADWNYQGAFQLFTDEQPLEDIEVFETSNYAYRDYRENLVYYYESFPNTPSTHRDALGETLEKFSMNEHSAVDWEKLFIIIHETQSEEYMNGIFSLSAYKTRYAVGVKYTYNGESFTKDSLENEITVKINGTGMGHPDYEFQQYNIMTNGAYGVQIFNRIHHGYTEPIADIFGVVDTGI